MNCNKANKLNVCRKFEVDLNTNYSEEKKAIATTVRIMLEEHLYW